MAAWSSRPTTAASDENINIIQVSPGVFTVAAGAAGTTVNGGASFTNPASTPVFQDVRVQLRGGTDIANVTGGFIGRDLVINPGSGNKTYTIANATVGRNLAVTTLGGVDSINLDPNVRVAGNATLNVGDGDNTVNVIDSLIGKNLTITGGSNNDHVSVLADVGRRDHERRRQPADRAGRREQ